MIIKSYEVKKKEFKNIKFFLLYGKNQGLINETIKFDLKPKLSENIHRYEETEILKDIDNFKETIFNRSFFENEKLIIISRTTDKISQIIREIIEVNMKEISIILIADILEKKSKLRNFFEKNDFTVCIPFYEDNNLTLGKLALDFFRKRNINISQQNINIIVERCNGDRINLNNELEKIESFSINQKKITTDDLIKLTNLAENIDYTHLVNFSLAKDKKKTINILNENNFAVEESIIIIRIFLSKLKRLLKIFTEIKTSNNLETAITSFKPPIFWKEKDIIKQQIKILDYQKVQDLIVKTCDLELLIKKNPSITTNLVTDFILDQCTNTNN